MIIMVEELTYKLIDEVMPIIQDNHDISGHFSELNIDWNSYLSIGDAFSAFVMRNECDEIVGILFFAIGAYPHNYEWMMAQQITFYVQPEYRKWSMKFMQYSEDFLKKAGVDIIIQAARVGTIFCKTLEQKGYSPADVTYTKRLT